MFTTEMYIHEAQYSIVYFCPHSANYNLKFLSKQLCIVVIYFPYFSKLNTNSNIFTCNKIRKECDCLN